MVLKNFKCCSLFSKSHLSILWGYDDLENLCYNGSIKFQLLWGLSAVQHKSMNVVSNHCCCGAWIALWWLWTMKCNFYPFLGFLSRQGLKRILLHIFHTNLRCILFSIMKLIRKRDQQMHSAVMNVQDSGLKRFWRVQMGIFQNY